jgi:hypothetical protein
MFLRNKKSFGRIAFWGLSISVVLLMSACPKSAHEGNKSTEVISGEYYSFQCRNRDYKVLKVLLVEENLMHVCYYNNIFKEKPTVDVIGSLYFGEKQFQSAFLSIEDGKQATGRKHMALTIENWEYWKPEFLSDGTVTEDETQAYEKWKNGDRYVSGVLVRPTH